MVRSFDREHQVVKLRSMKMVATFISVSVERSVIDPGVEQRSVLSTSHHGE